jgi:hypothetical protein
MAGSKEGYDTEGVVLVMVMMIMNPRQTVSDEKI